MFKLTFNIFYLSNFNFTIISNYIDYHFIVRLIIFEILIITIYFKFFYKEHKLLNEKIIKEDKEIVKENDKKFKNEEFELIDKVEASTNLKLVLFLSIFTILNLLIYFLCLYSDRLPRYLNSNWIFNSFFDRKISYYFVTQFFLYFTIVMFLINKNDRGLYDMQARIQGIKILGLVDCFLLIMCVCSSKFMQFLHKFDHIMDGEGLIFLVCFLMFCSIIFLYLAYKLKVIGFQQFYDHLFIFFLINLVCISFFILLFFNYIIGPPYMFIGTR